MIVKNMECAHRNIWNDTSIEKEIMNVVRIIGDSHFPTHSEIEKITGNKCLTNAISKHGGTRYWSKKLGLDVKQCESEFGNDYEIIAMSDIKSNCCMNSIKTKPRYPYDILTENNIKVDVKVSKRIFTNCHTWQNTFNIEKKEPTCDIFIFYCLDQNSNHIKTVILPSCVLSGKTQIGIGENSKYNKYIDNWNIFNEYKKFYDDINKNNHVY